MENCHVSPLHKKGGIDCIDNYRGISVLPPISKIFEKILAKQITEYFNSNNLFVDSQHGFRSGFSCETAIQAILDDWKRLIDEKNVVLSLFIDFKKAFDLINQNLLFIKLFHYGFQNESLNLLKNYFSDRSQQTRIGLKLSTSEAAPSEFLKVQF